MTLILCRKSENTSQAWNPTNFNDFMFRKHDPLGTLDYRFYFEPKGERPYQIDMENQ